MTPRKAAVARASRPLRIVFAASEALPYFKSGGLADVARSLPDALRKRGHDVQIVQPLYAFVQKKRLRLVEADGLSVPWLGGTITCRVHTHSPRGAATGVLLEHAAFAVSATPYEDPDPLITGRRFALFARALLHYARRVQADIIHLNDWQTGLVPAYALIDGVSIPTLFSIHNLAYQGIFERRILDEIGLPREFFRVENGLEFYGNVSYLKGGLALSDRITTVSPTYAREIQTPEYGAGFDGLLRFRRRDLFGILNGIDNKTWDPATDEALSIHYDADSLVAKDELRAAFVKQWGMAVERPLLVVVSRLAHQKGIDLVLAAAQEIMDAGANLFVLGDGDPALEARFAEVTRRFPGRIIAVVKFDDALARHLYAAGDFFVMPSRYEPCGLGQMIAQRYGTPPIVRATGGLRDTVRDGETGFCFEQVSSADFMRAAQRALGVWRGPQWDDLRKRCMQLDWSWRVSAQQYEDVYASISRPMAG